MPRHHDRPLSGRSLERIDRQLHIGQLAGELQINPKTIRYYEQTSPFPTPRRTPAGYRIYGPADRERLRFIGQAKRLGMTLAEIGDILTLRDGGACPRSHVFGVLDHKLAAIDAQLRTLENLRRELRFLREETATATQDCGPICAIIEHHQPMR